MIEGLGKALTADCVGVETAYVHVQSATSRQHSGRGRDVVTDAIAQGAEEGRGVMGVSPDGRGRVMAEVPLAELKDSRGRCIRVALRHPGHHGLWAVKVDLVVGEYPHRREICMAHVRDPYGSHDERPVRWQVKLDPDADQGVVRSEVGLVCLLREPPLGCGHLGLSPALAPATGERQR